MPDQVSSSAPPATRILLGGGGSAEDERPIYERFAAWAGGGRVLYLPIAAEQPGSAHLAWVTSVLTPLGVHQVDMWTTLAGHQPAELWVYAGIFIGGGNTYWLLHQLRTGGFDDAIRQYALGGGALYGGSAGAIVLGANISTCAHMDHNDVGISDMHGLDLLDGHAVWCHYRAADYPITQVFVRRTRLPTYLLAETTGLWRRSRGDFVSFGWPAAYLLTSSMVA
ncbi:MAG: Type 1 glutamine amidotransferase-like domain-containing protein [Caldilineaceae bacterium]